MKVLVWNCRKLGLRFYILILAFAFVYSCTNSDSPGSGITSNDPKTLASITYEIGQSTRTDEDIAAIFKGYGYSLSEGTKAFELAYKQVTSDVEKNKIYQQELFKFMESSIFGSQGANIGDNLGSVSGGDAAGVDAAK